MATSGSTNFTVTRDDIITRALRIVSGIGQGETPTTVQISEASMALNMLTKQWQADGMQLWTTYGATITLVAGTRTYPMGIGSTINQDCFLRVINAFYRTVDNVDVPLDIVTRNDYNDYPTKITSGGDPIMIYYTPPRNMASGQMTSQFTIAPTPDATTVANIPTILVTGITAIQDFDASTDTPDFPSYWYNALVWGLASELAYEYGVPLAERSQIEQKAVKHKLAALVFDYEEGSLFIHPDTQRG